MLWLSVCLCVCSAWHPDTGLGTPAHYSGEPRSAAERFPLTVAGHAKRVHIGAPSCRPPANPAKVPAARQAHRQIPRRGVVRHQGGARGFARRDHLPAPDDVDSWPHLENAEEPGHPKLMSMNLPIKQINDWKIDGPGQLTPPRQRGGARTPKLMPMNLRIKQINDWRIDGRICWCRRAPWSSETLTMSTRTGRTQWWQCVLFTSFIVVSYFTIGRSFDGLYIFFYGCCTGLPRFANKRVRVVLFVSVWTVVVSIAVRPQVAAGCGRGATNSSVVGQRIRMRG